jgi:hypothetical protein
MGIFYFLNLQLQDLINDLEKFQTGWESKMRASAALDAADIS